MKVLNEKLDEFCEKPRNLSEPRKRYVPSPDFTPEALEAADEAQRKVLAHQMQQVQETGQPIRGHYAYDIVQKQLDSQKLAQFLDYRRQFERS